MDRLTMTDAEMEEIRQYDPDFDCPVKADGDSQILNFCDYVCDEFQHNCPFKNMGNRLKAYEDAEEQGLLFRKVWILNCFCSKPKDCEGDCEYCDMNELEVEEIIIKCLDFDETKHYKTKEDAKQALKQMGE